MSEKPAIDRVVSTWQKDYATLSEWFNKAKGNYRMYLGDQWHETSKPNRLEGEPDLSINFIQKHIDVISGHERQNRTDVIALPIEGTDDEKAEIYTHSIKWVLDSQNNSFITSDSFKDCLICGGGWVVVDFDGDERNSNIVITKESPFCIIPDPYMTRSDMRDCSRVCRYKYIDKAEAMRLWPDKAKVIKVINSDKEMSDKPIQYSVEELKDKVNIIEMWEKRIRGITYEYGSDGELKAKSSKSKDRYNKGEEDYIHLTIVARGDTDVLLYDGDAPWNLKHFPFIPMFGKFTSSFPDWKWKLQGIVDALEDIQKEKNKRRSQMTRAVMTMPHGGWMIREGEDGIKNQLIEPGTKYITVRRMPNEEGASLGQLPPTNIDPGLLTLEQLSDADENKVGTNPDLLGYAEQGGSGPSAPGITLQLRMKQALAHQQESFDNKSIAKRLLGNIIIEMMNKNWDVSKFKRIIGIDAPFEQEIQDMKKQWPQAMAQGQEAIQQFKQSLAYFVNEQENFWQNFMETKDEAVYDCKVEEVEQSPSYKLMIGDQLLQIQHQGGPVSWQVLMDYIAIPPSAKKRWLADIQQQQQSQMEIEKMKLQSQMASIQAQGKVAAEIEKLKGQFDLEKEKLKGQFDLQVQVMKGDIELLKAGLQQKKSKEE